jgi:hypothetical protein
MTIMRMLIGIANYTVSISPWHSVHTDWLHIYGQNTTNAKNLDIILWYRAQSSEDAEYWKHLEF